MTFQDIDWDATVRDVSPGLLRYFMAVFPRPLAADMVQEVLLRLVMKVRSGRFQANEGTLRMYAYGIARLVRLEGRRSEGRVLELVNPDQIATPALEDRDDKERLRAAVARLKPVEQDVILLLLDKDLSLEEIGKLLDLPLGTVKSHVHRAKESLKTLLGSRSAEER
jgi:RNA polymerase sigma-70 factor (ECF subfamily)